MESGCLYVTREHGVEAGGAHLSKTTKGEAAGFGGGAKVSLVTKEINSGRI